MTSQALHISIITVCYNSEATIADTLATVAAQDWPEREHLIIDGASTDNTAKIVADFIAKHPHLNIQWHSAKDQGLYDAMNKGIALAKNGIIGLLNADDYYTNPKVLSRVASCFEQQEIDGLYADLQYVDGQSTQKIVRKWKSGSYRKNAFLWGWMPPHPTFFVYKKLVEQLGNYRLDMGSAADYELMLRFIHRHQIKLGYLAETIINMRTGGVSNKALKNRLAANRMDQKAWEVNGLKPYWITRFLKPLRKVTQFLG